MYINKNTKIMLASVVFLYILSGIFRLIDVHVDGLPLRLSAISYLGHLTLCTLYVVYTRRNIIQPDVKYYITSAVVYLYGWLIIALMEEVIFPIEHPGNRVLWYMYYIPTLMIPNLLLIASLYFDMHGSQRVSKVWWLTFAITFAIIVTIMTNDLHKLAFTFPEGLQNFYRSYEYNIVYYISMAWMFTMFIGCGIVIWQKAKYRRNRKHIWVVYTGLGISIVYFIWWIMGRPIFPWINDMYGVPQVFEAFVLLTTEMCMRFGLISANSNFREFFEASQLSISLVDGEGNTIYKTANQIPITKSQMAQALKEDIYIDDDHRLHGQEISGGHVFWVNDLSSINKVAKRLRHVQSELEEDNNLIAAENDMIARMVQADEQNKLYTMLAQQMQPQLDRIENIVENIKTDDPDFLEKLALASVYKVYIKRSCNIMLLRQNDPVLNAFELENSIRESLDYIQLNGITCGYTSNAKADFSADDLLRTYNYFQEIVEANLSTMKELFVELSVEPDRINLKMTVDGRVYDKEIIAQVVGEQRMLRPTKTVQLAVSETSTDRDSAPQESEEVSQEGGAAK